MSQTRSQGWQLTLTHPDTGRTLSPDVLDDPEFLPSLNALVEARIPVRRSQDLLEWPSGTTVSLSLNGQDQPLDEVVNIEQQSDRTILVAEGGVELDNRVRTEYQDERRTVAAQEIIESETTYTADIDTPEFADSTDELLQDADTTSELLALLNADATTPVSVTNGRVEIDQTCFTREGFDEDRTSGGATAGTDPEASDGTFARIQNSGDAVEYDITTDYKIPGENVSFFIRHRNTDTPPEVTLSFNGETWTPLADGVGLLYQWTDFADLIGGSSSYSGADVPAGNHTLRIEATTNGTDPFDIDVLTVVQDNRFNYNLDNDNGGNGGYLDGPETQPDNLEVNFDDVTTPFVYTGATATISVDDTSSGQAVAISPDRGNTKIEEPNAETVTASDLQTSSLRVIATLDRYSPDGARDQTPRFGYASQSLDSVELRADSRQESLLIDQTFDNSVASVLNQIAGDEYIWSYRLENGTPTIAWTQPGQRTADSDPDIDASVSVSKDIKTWDAVTIKGSAQSVSGEVFSGSTTYQALNRDNIVPGAEAVRDPNTNTQFVRSEDYEMRYNPGEIRILDSGDMSGGTTYEIDYRYEVEGTFPEGYAGDNELVETISGVVSDRQARQLAYIILEVDPGVADPSWSADVLLPRGDGLFDPLEALSLEQLPLPDEATPLEIREPPQETPQGIALRLGSGRGLDEALSSLSNQLTNVSRRS